MFRSLIWTCLGDIERVEFGTLECAPRDLAGAVTTRAVEEINPKSLDLYAATREWLTAIPGDRESGWLERYALTLIP
jgi:hypothetical protein